MDDTLSFKLLNFFFENSFDEVYLRELARKTKLSPFAVKKYVDIFLTKGLIIEQKRANLRYFKANVSSLLFKHLKIAWNVDKLVESGLIGLVSSNQGVSSLILFGSMAKGTDDKKSDVDLVVIGGSKSLNISKIETKLGREVNIHVFSWSEWKMQTKTNAAFYSDVIIYGIPLYGELPLVN